MTDKKYDFDQRLEDEWRQLGFYYDFDERISVNQWRFFGTRKGLQNFINLLNEYINHPANNELSEHDHYGPYSYLKIMTWDKPVITNGYFAGTLDDLRKLKQIMSDKLGSTQVGETFTVDKDYGTDNTVTTKFFVMADNFDPVSMDELIISGRQKIANEYWEKQKQNKN